MMNKEWNHITKLDPDKEISEERVEQVVKSGTDALMISGTQGVTKEKIENLMQKVNKYDIPKILEPSDPTTVVYDDFDDIYVPCVINSQNPQWIAGHHAKWTEHFDPQWDRIKKEAYIVLNPDSAVGRVTDAKTDLSPEAAASYAEVAEKYFDFPIIYIEYSGTYGDPEVVKAISEAIDDAIVFYGGGIKSKEQSAEMLQYADTVIVGNVIYEESLDVYLSTVEGTKGK